MIIDFVLRWQMLGVKTYLTNCTGKIGNIKHTKGLLEVDIEDPINPLWSTYNFIGIDLGDSGISCLDIEGTKNSVEEFKRRLESNKIDLDSLFWEKSMRGIHVYFRRKDRAHIKSFKGLSDGDIRFDILNSGKAFTTPSKFEKWEYKWGKNTPFTISSIEEIPEVPEWLNDVFRI